MKRYAGEEENSDNSIKEKEGDVFAPQYWHWV